MRCAKCKTEIMLCPSCKGGGGWYAVDLGLDPKKRVEDSPITNCPTCSGDGILLTSNVSIKKVMKELANASKRFQRIEVLEKDQPTQKRTKSKSASRGRKSTSRSR